MRVRGRETNRDATSIKIYIYVFSNNDRINPTIRQIFIAARDVSMLVHLPCCPGTSSSGWASSGSGLSSQPEPGSPRNSPQGYTNRYRMFMKISPYYQEFHFSFSLSVSVAVSDFLSVCLFICLSLSFASLPTG